MVIQTLTACGTQYRSDCQIVSAEAPEPYFAATCPSAWSCLCGASYCRGCRAVFQRQPDKRPHCLRTNFFQKFGRVWPRPRKEVSSALEAPRAGLRSPQN